MKACRITILVVYIGVHGNGRNASVLKVAILMLLVIEFCTE